MGTEVEPGRVSRAIFLLGAIKKERKQRWLEFSEEDLDAKKSFESVRNKRPPSPLFCNLPSNGRWRVVSRRECKEFGASCRLSVLPFQIHDVSDPW